jgi:hypothetical protein
MTDVYQSRRTTQLGERIFNWAITRIPSHWIRQSFLRKFGATIGTNTSIMMGTTVLGIDRLVIGDNCSIGFHGKKTAEADRCNAGTVRVGQRALAHAGANLLAINAPSQALASAILPDIYIFQSQLRAILPDIRMIANFRLLLCTQIGNRSSSSSNNAAPARGRRRLSSSSKTRARRCWRCPRSGRTERGEMMAIKL